MLVAIGGEFSVLDRVSQPLTFGSLFGPLVQGYALDAIGVADAAAPSVDAAQALLVNLAKDLAAKGEIMISKNRGDEELVY